MAGSRNHTGLSWANIMLQHTAPLTDEKEQALFWNWLTNPDDLECMHTTIGPVPEYNEAPEKLTLGKTEINNAFHTNGLCRYVSTEPSQDSSTQTQPRLLSANSDGGDEKVPEIASAQSEQSEQKADTTASTC